MGSFHLGRSRRRGLSCSVIPIPMWSAVLLLSVAVPRLGGWLSHRFPPVGAQLAESLREALLGWMLELRTPPLLACFPPLAVLVQSLASPMVALAPLFLSLVLVEASQMPI